jgi:tetratricopeptide (TPR) repeat protein
VARLRHPNVVQLYEAGEWQGTPYFAMEYVEGGSLAERLAVGPLAPHRGGVAGSSGATLTRMLHRTGERGLDALPGMQQLRRWQVEDALAFYQDIARQRGDDPLVRQDVAWACMEAAKMYLLLGRSAEARAHCTRAVQMAEMLAAEQPGELSRQSLLADALGTLGMLEGLGPGRPAALERGVALLEKVVGEGHDAVRGQLANGHVNLAEAYHQRGLFPRAQRSLMRAIELYDDLARRETSTPATD